MRVIFMICVLFYLGLNKVSPEQANFVTIVWLSGFIYALIYDYLEYKKGV